MRESERNGLELLLMRGMGDGSVVFGMGSWGGWKMGMRMSVRKWAVMEI